MLRSQKFLSKQPFISRVYYSTGPKRLENGFLHRLPLKSGYGISKFAPKQDPPKQDVPVQSSSLKDDPQLNSTIQSQPTKSYRSANNNGKFSPFQKPGDNLSKVLHNTMYSRFENDTKLNTHRLSAPLDRKGKPRPKQPQLNQSQRQSNDTSKLRSNQNDQYNQNNQYNRNGVNNQNNQNNQFNRNGVNNQYNQNFEDEASRRARLYAKNLQAEKSNSFKKNNKTTKFKKKQDILNQPKIKVTIPNFISIGNLSNILNIKTNLLLAKMEEFGFDKMTYDFIIDGETAGLIANEFNFEINIDDEEGFDLFPQTNTPEEMAAFPTRPPIVTIMGHVDHGKTTILDYLRKSKIVDTEHGGITQRIGAFSINIPSGAKITFLDTPGHAAFLKMRERGANVTDIVVLVVAADDSVMPQTKEAIKHAKQAGVQVIVAINKCDKPGVNPDKVVADLAANDVLLEEYSGDIQSVRVSGLTGLNIDKLEEAIVTLSEIMDLRADKSGMVEASVIESQVKKGLGNTATILVRRGTLIPGSILVAGNTWCKVKSMKDENGKVVKSAGPAIPVEVLGWKDLPVAGDEVLQAKNESIAKKVIANRITREEKIKEAKDVEVINNIRKKSREEAEKKDQLEQLAQHGLTIDDIKNSKSDMAGFTGEEEDENKQKEIQFIICGDVSGSVEAVVESIEGMGNNEVISKVVHTCVGPPTESNIILAKTSGAKILTFNVAIPKDVRQLAHNSGVEIVEYSIIYKLLEGVTDILIKNLKPKIEVKVLGEANVKSIFNISGKGKDKGKDFIIAGCRVSNGTISRNSTIRILRNKNEEIYKGKINGLKFGKDDTSEVTKGKECGISIQNFKDFKEGDIIKAIEETKVMRTYL